MAWAHFNWNQFMLQSVAIKRSALSHTQTQHTTRRNHSDFIHRVLAAAAVQKCRKTKDFRIFFQLCRVVSRSHWKNPSSHFRVALKRYIVNAKHFRSKPFWRVDCGIVCMCVECGHIFFIFIIVFFRHLQCTPRGTMSGGMALLRVERILNTKMKHDFCRLHFVVAQQNTMDTTHTHSPV